MNYLDKQFLGPEFLTWLYFKLFEESFEIDLPEVFEGKGYGPVGGVVRFAMGKRVTLRAADLVGAKVGLNGPGLENNGEVLQAVRRGAVIESMSLDMAVDSRVYSFTLNASDGAITGFKLPDLFTMPDEDDKGSEEVVLEGDEKPKRRTSLPADAVLDLRTTCMDEVDRVVDALFNRFIALRLTKAWSYEVQKVRQHVAAGLRARLLTTTPSV